MIQLRCQDSPGSGRELQALLPKGFVLDQGGATGEEQWITIWYERWVQFPGGDLEALQDEIMNAIQEVIEKRATNA